MSIREKPIFFANQAKFRAWLKKNHAICSEQWVGFHRKSSGLPSITWPESVDQALCFGWIDGLRKTVDEKSYQIRFTPRRSNSVWSVINRRKFQELKRQGQVRSAGIKAYQRKTSNKSGIYSYENRKSAVLSASERQRFRLNRKAWRWFRQQAPSYQQTVTWWIASAKRIETRQKRLARLITDSSAGRRVGLLQRTVKT